MDVVVKYGEVHGILQTYKGYSLRIYLFLKTFFFFHIVHFVGNRRY